MIDCTYNSVVGPSFALHLDIKGFSGASEEIRKNKTSETVTRSYSKSSRKITAVTGISVFQKHATEIVGKPENRKEK